jgi:hypothetical protein
MFPCLSLSTSNLEYQKPNKNPFTLTHSLNSNGHSHTLLSPIPCNVKKEKHSQNNKTYLLKPTHYFYFTTSLLSTQLTLIIWLLFRERERDKVHDNHFTLINSLIRRRLQSYSYYLAALIVHLFLSSSINKTHFSSYFFLTHSFIFLSFLANQTQGNLLFS